MRTGNYNKRSNNRKKPSESASDNKKGRANTDDWN